MDGAFALVMKPLLYLKMDTFGNSKRKKKGEKIYLFFHHQQEENVPARGHSEERKNTEV